MAIDETKALALTLGEAVEAFDLIGNGRVVLIHREGNFMRTRRVGKPAKH